MKPRGVPGFLMFLPLVLVSTGPAQVRTSRSAPGSDSLVARAIAEIDPDSVRHFIQGLQDFGTRYCLSTNRDTVADWIRQQFFDMGYADVVTDSFQFQNTWQKNVIATLPGVSAPDEVVVIGAHHDSYSSQEPMLSAPGADDNASGCAAALEIARVLKHINYHPESAIKFMTFAAEELGSYGSRTAASRERGAGTIIKLMINGDMISYTTRPISGSSVRMYSSDEYSSIAAAAASLTRIFSTLTPRIGLACVSDDCSFWEAGYPSVGFIEDEGVQPYVHSSRDVLSNYNMDYCAEVIKVMCAMAMRGSSSPQMLHHLSVDDPGDGTSLLVRWNRSIESNLNGYRLHVGRSKGADDTVMTTIDTSIVVGNLIEGVQYFVGVAAFDTDGHEGFVIEQTGVPHLKPLSPSRFVADPLWHRVSLHWDSNKELDLAGYNVYRSPSPTGSPVRLNSTILKDSTFQDTSAENGRYYYYSASAVDITQNESTPTVPIRSRTVTLDQGILIVNETKGGDGSPMHPTSAQVDSFYHRLVAGFRVEDFDAETGGVATLADLGAYSTVVWHGNDATSFAAAVSSRDHIGKYLRFGGKMIVSTYRPMAAFGNFSGTSHDFSAGDFAYDYLKIAHSENRTFSRFIGAVSVMSGYSSLYVDTSKTASSLNFHLDNIEGVWPAPGAAGIYRYDTYYDTSQLQGKMKGQTVGIEYLGSDFNMVFVSFPLYFMNFDAAKGLVRFILATKFSEPLAVQEKPAPLPLTFELFQNYPNPFNPETQISFEIPRTNLKSAISARVTLRVFDVLGREVATLMNEVKTSGAHRVTWNARDVASGVYLYRLESGGFVSVRKMLLLR